MTIYGCARVSTDGQSLEARQAALSAAAAEQVFAEKVSGAVTDRRALAKAVAATDQGDVLLVTKLDRLARSTSDLLNTLAAIGDRGAGFRSLGVNAASNFPKCAEVKFLSWRVSVISRPGGDQGLHFLAAVRGGVANVPGLAR